MPYTVREVWLFSAEKPHVVQLLRGTPIVNPLELPLWPEEVAAVASSVPHIVPLR